MDKKFALEAKKLRNIVLFNPEVGPDDMATTESSIFLKIANGNILFEILSFRYLLIGQESIESNESIEMILPLKRLQDIIKSFSDDTKISFKEEKDKSVTVEADGVKFKIKTCEQEGRNQIGEDRGEEYKISSEALLDGIKKVRIAMGDDEVRYYLNGICLEIYRDSENNNHIFMAATNGHILATFGEKNTDWKLIQKCIMPKKVIPEIVKILEKSEGDVSVSFSKNKMNLKTTNLEILLKLIEADFPDYEKVIPYKNDKEIKFNTNSLKDILAKVSIVSSDKTKNVKIMMNSGSADLEISSSDGNTANGNVSIDFSGSPIEITLNAKYIMDILAQINEKDIIFKVDDGISPLLIQQDKNKNILFVLMPVRS